MSYREKPILKLYKYQNGSFVLQAQIDDYMEASWEDNLYQAGRFSITINFNIPNASLFERKLFIQFGNSTKFGEITTIQDSIGQDGKGSQLRVISGYDARYILKRRVIKNTNSNGLWQMTDKGELCIRNLIKDQCGSSAEVKRRLPIINTIPASENAIGKEYTVSESFTNLYEVCKTIATQSEIGWRINFDGEELTLICFPGTDRSDSVRFDTDFESLRDGEFSDSSESYSNTIYVGGKGQNDDRDIYEGEDLIGGESPASLDRFESWDNQSSLTTEEEYEAEALSMLNQYGQTITMSGNGLAKCPYEYEKEYFVGDTIILAFSGKSAKVQILSVTEHWTWASYEIQFQFGKPQNNLADQLQLMLRQIQRASNKQSAVDSVRWYELPDDDEMPKADVTYDTLGFTGAVPNNGTFKLYLDDEKTGSKYYDIYVKNLTGNKLTLTTEKTIEGQPAQDLVLNIGTYVANIYVDENGNIILNSSTPAQTVEQGNNQPVTSDAVYQAMQGGGSGGGVPIGFVGAYYGTTDPDGWFICNGRDTTGTDIELETNFPALYAFLGNSNVLPDLRKRFVEGADNDVGTYIVAGIPNITGTTKHVQYMGGASGSGAFSHADSSSNNSAYNGNTTKTQRLSFNAKSGETKTDGTLKGANDTKVYGESDTVQPASLRLNYIIKAR